MVFKRKKDNAAMQEGISGMRGRENADRNPDTTPENNPNPLARRFQADDEPETVDLMQPTGFQQTSDEDSGEGATRILSGTEVDEEPGAKEELENPVSGFLVVIEGPGRGSVCMLGYGTNPVGRDPDQSISLDYGDPYVSRESHCLVTFDPVTAKFWIQPGEGHNLAYLDDQPVLVPTELGAGDHIRLGATMLRFVPLCGEGFSWGT